MRRSEIIALVSWGCIGIGALVFGRYVAAGIESGLADRTQEKLSVIGYPEVVVDVDGMVLEVTGRIKTSKDREILLATLESTPGVDSVIDNLVLVSPLVELTPAVLFVQKDAEAFTLSGEAPNPAARDLLAARVELALNGAAFSNLMKSQDRAAPEEWLAAAEAAIDAVSALRVGQATVERGVVRVVGAAPDARARDRIAARLQARIDPTFSLTMEISAPPPLLSPYTFTARKSETRGLEVTRCAVPNDQLLSVVLGELKSRGVRTDDTLCTIANGAPNDAWIDAILRSLEAITPLLDGEVRIVDDRVFVDGFLPDGAVLEEVRSEIEARWPDLYSVEVFLQNELPVVTPYTLTAVKQVESAHMSGHAPSRELADNWADALDATNELSLARGHPEGWAAAVNVVLEALAAAPVGAATFNDSDITLATPGDVRDRVILHDRLQAAMPPNFTLRVMEAHVPKTAAAAALPPVDPLSEPLDAGKYTFSARKNLDAPADVGGVMADESSLRIVRGYAGNRLGSDMAATFLVGESAAPLGWDRALFAGLEALSHLDEGELIIEPGAVYLRGFASELARVEQSQATLDGKTPDDFTRFAELAFVDPTAVALGPEERPLTPQECVDRLNEIMRDTPIRFVVGKPSIDPESYPIVAELTEVFLRCPEARIEVGGHTDSVGSDDLNKTLSLHRATAVSQSIVAGGAVAANVLAMGYGESQPIADNATETGQEKNRRIEFKLLE